MQIMPTAHSETPARLIVTRFEQAGVLFRQRAMAVWALLVLLASLPAVIHAIDAGAWQGVLPVLTFSALALTLTVLFAGKMIEGYWATDKLSPLLRGVGMVYLALVVSGLFTAVLFQALYLQSLDVLASQSPVYYGAGLLWGYLIGLHKRQLARRTAEEIASELAPLLPKPSPGATTPVAMSLVRNRMAHPLTVAGTGTLLFGLIMGSLPFGSGHSTSVVGVFAVMTGLACLTVRSVWALTMWLGRRQPNEPGTVTGELLPMTSQFLLLSVHLRGNSARQSVIGEVALMRLLPGAYERECEELVTTRIAGVKQDEGIVVLPLVPPPIPSGTTDLDYLAYVLRLQLHTKDGEWRSRESLRLPLQVQLDR